MEEKKGPARDATQQPLWRRDITVASAFTTLSRHRCLRFIDRFFYLFYLYLDRNITILY